MTKSQPLKTCIDCGVWITAKKTRCGPCQAERIDSQKRNSAKRRRESIKPAPSKPERRLSHGTKSKA